MVLLPRTNMVVFAESALKPFLTLPYLTNVSQNRKSFCSLFASCFCIVKSKDGIIKAGCWKLISLNDEMTLGKYSRERETGMILFITLWLLIYAFESGVRTISMRQWKAWDHDFFFIDTTYLRRRRPFLVFHFFSVPETILAVARLHISIFETCLLTKQSWVNKEILQMRHRCLRYLLVCCTVNCPITYTAYLFKNWEIVVPNYLCLTHHVPVVVHCFFALCR